MRILHVIAELDPRAGGPPKAALEMCQALAREGQEVTLFTTNYTRQGVLEAPLGRPVNLGGVEVFYFPYSGSRRWLISLPLARALRSQVSQYDLVEIHSLYLFHGLVAGHYCRKYQVPYLIQPHGSLDPYIRRRGRIKKAIYHLLFENRNLDQAAAIHYTAMEEKELAHAAVGIKAPALVAPLGLALEDYKNLPAKGLFRAKHPDLANKPVVLFLGRINFIKGLDLLAEAFGRVARAHPEARLVIAGPEDPGYGDRVRGWLAEAGVLDKTLFTGMLQGTDKLSALVDADVFVLPSYSENFGITVVEAMACGLPVITTDKVNIWREIQQAGAGEIISCDAGPLSEALLRLLGDPQRRAALSLNGHRLVEEKYDWRIIAKQLANEYQKIITKHH